MDGRRAGCIWRCLLDLYSRKVVGWAMSSQIDTALVQDALHDGVGTSSARRQVCCITRIEAVNMPVMRINVCWQHMGLSAA